MERFADIVQKVKFIVGESVTVVHVTMFPRFVKECCRAHVADEDVWLLDGVRRDVNKEIVDRMTEKGLGSGDGGMVDVVGGAGRDDFGRVEKDELCWR